MKVKNIYIVQVSHPYGVTPGYTQTTQLYELEDGTWFLAEGVFIPENEARELIK